MAVMHQNRKNNILLGQNNNALTWLIIINLVAFTTLFFVKVVYESIYASSKIPHLGDTLFDKEVVSWLVLPASFKVFLTRPWTLLTYMFVHTGPAAIFQMISTGLWLWSFGYILQDLTGNSKLIPLYLYGGIAGGIMYLLTVNILPGLNHQAVNAAPLITGSAAIMSVAIATTVLSPGYRIFRMLNGGIPLWILTAAFLLIQFSSIAITNWGFAAATIGAGLFGVLFIRELRRGRDWGAWMGRFVEWVDNLFNPEKKLAKEDIKQKLFYKSAKKPFIKKTVITQQRVDELLDKINQKGYHLLTDEEKDFLKKASEQDMYM